MSDNPTEIARCRRASLMTEHVAHERVDVMRHCCGVVEAVGREVRVAEAAEVWDDHLEPGFCQWRDVAPPDAFGLRIAMQEKDGESAGALPDVGEVEAIGDGRPLHREAERVDVGPSRRASVASLHRTRPGRRRLRCSQHG